jgi:hypothetical protein
LLTIREIAAIPKRYIPTIDRVFIADGDALVYPKDRDRLIADLDAALIKAGTYPGFLDSVPEYEEEYY